jgi:hypothetical protein
MAKWHKLLDRMRNNPKDDWEIDDFETVSRHIANKPIKSVYVKAFVSMIDSITEEGTGQ